MVSIFYIFSASQSCFHFSDGNTYFLGCWAIETSFLIPQATRRTIQLDRLDFTQRFLLVSIFYIFSASFLDFPVPSSRTIHLLAGWAFETSLLISKTTPRAIQLDCPDFTQRFLLVSIFYIFSASQTCFHFSDGNTSFLGWAFETSFLIPQATRRTIQLDRPDFTQRFLLVSIFYIFSASFLGFPVPWSRTIHLLAGWAFETSLVISKTTPRAIQLDQNDFTQRFLLVSIFYIFSASQSCFHFSDGNIHLFGCWAFETSFLIPQATRRTIQLDRPDFTQRFLLVSIFYIFSASFLGFPVPWSRTIHLLAGWAFETSLVISKTTPRAIQLDQNDFTQRFLLVSIFYIFSASQSCFHFSDGNILFFGAGLLKPLS